MKKIFSFVLVAVLLASGMSFAVTAAPQSLDAVSYSYADVVRMMTDMERLALTPAAGEVGAEASSYDRASRYVAATDTYVGWGANGDNAGVIQNLGDVPGKGVQYLVADLKGPGVIWRTWSAAPNQGLIEVYIDGETTPTVSRPLIQMFGGAAEPFNYPGLTYVTPAQGHNCFVPITYNESCKVYLYGNWGAYYQFTYATFPEGTTVEPMPDTMSQADKDALTAANTAFTNGLGTNPTPAASGDKTVNGDFTVAPGTSATVVDEKGEGAIASFKVKVNDKLGYDAMWDALQQLTVSMYWDGETAPSVWAPLGDFFGAPMGDPYTTLPMGLLKNGWYYCYFYMPFASGAKIVIGNDGPTAKSVSVAATVTPLKNVIGKYTRFHAKWNKDQKQPTRTDVWPDYTVVKTTGAGRFLGFMLHVYEKGNHGWWGEGDEKFFVDGEKFPSSFGTGSEDYFGYAWCDATIFNDKALHAQPHNEGGIGGVGNKVVLRYQTFDSVPFFDSFDGYIEKYHDNDMSEYSVMPYWYLAPGGTDDYGPATLSDRTKFYKKPLYSSSYIEAETLAPNVTAGTPQPEVATSGFGSISAGRLLLWSNTAVDNEITLPFELVRPLDGQFKIRVGRGPEFGCYQFYLDGKPVGRPVDLYFSKRINSAYIPLGPVLLEDGPHILTAKAVGKNAAATNYSFALDLLGFVSGRFRPGMIEGEDMTVTEISRGSFSLQGMGGFSGSWSGNEQLWWTGTQGNSVLKLGFYLDAPIENQTAKIAFTKAIDYGKFQAAIDGVDIGAVQDGYNNGVVHSGAVSLGPISLAAGEHVLTITMKDKNPLATAFMFGLDYLLLSEYAGYNVFLDDVDNLNGVAGTQFKVPVHLSDFPADDQYKAIEGMVKIPAGAKLVDIKPSDFATFKDFDYAVDSQGVLRFVFTSMDGKPVGFDTAYTDEIMTLTLELTQNFDEGATLEVAFNTFAVRSRDHIVPFDVADGVSTVTIASSGIFKAFVRELYTGDGTDFIPAVKKAVAVEFTAFDGSKDVSLFGKPFYFSAEKTAKSGKTTYVGLIDTDVDIALLDASSFTVGGTSAQPITFGDVNGDGVNAQDALAVLSVWLRKAPAPSERGILVMNVCPDSGINTIDVVEIIDHYVNGRPFSVISK